MAKTVKKKKPASGSIKISESTHQMIVDYCGSMFKIGTWCDTQLKKAVEHAKQKEAEIV